MTASGTYRPKPDILQCIPIEIPAKKRLEAWKTRKVRMLENAEAVLPNRAKHATISTVHVNMKILEKQKLNETRRL